ncbi:hypothetical protein GGI07_002869 [Coemansia sp. Benny D115]|nr:hypothetical protein GGI07_002869 [Coemansia sp. Benny D115]
MSQTFTLINKSGKLYGQSQVYAGAVFGFDLAADYAPVFTLDIDGTGTLIKDIFYGGASMIGLLRGADQSRIEFSGLDVKAKGERLSFNYTWAFNYPKNKRYLWRMERKTRSVMYLEDCSNNKIIASFRRTLDDEKIEGRLTLSFTPDLPLLMLLLMSLKLGLVRVQASDAGVPYLMNDPGAVTAEVERLEAVRLAEQQGAAQSDADSKNETSSIRPQSRRSSSESFSIAGIKLFQRKSSSAKIK